MTRYEMLLEKAVAVLDSCTRKIERTAGYYFR